MSGDKKILCYTIGSDKIYFSDYITDESIACLMDCFDILVNDDAFRAESMCIGKVMEVYWAEL